jgi:Zn-finger nucleic acid-binding protein
MNCQNCGASMVVYPGQSYFFCEYCGSFHFPQESGQGIRVLGTADDIDFCPVCEVNLVHATIEELPVLHCPRCLGFLVHPDSFVEIVKWRRARARGPAAKPIPLNPRELEREISCPYCSQEMSVHPYYGPGNIVIDNCVRCKIIWLDYGELGKVVDAPGRDRGDYWLVRQVEDDEDIR